MKAILTVYRGTNAVIYLNTFAYIEECIRDGKPLKGVEWDDFEEVDDADEIKFFPKAVRATKDTDIFVTGKTTYTVYVKGEVVGNDSVKSAEDFDPAPRTVSINEEEEL